MCGGLAAPKACSRGARRQEKGIEGGGESAHRSLSPSASRPAQLVGATHPPQTRRPHPHCPPTRRGVPRGVAAPSPAVSVSKSTAVDSVATWVLRLSRDGHIGHRVLTRHSHQGDTLMGRSLPDKRRSIDWGVDSDMRDSYCSLGSLRRLTSHTATCELINLQDTSSSR